MDRSQDHTEPEWRKVERRVGSPPQDHNGGNNNLDNLGAQVEEWPSQEVVGGGIRMPH